MESDPCLLPPHVRLLLSCDVSSAGLSSTDCGGGGGQPRETSSPHLPSPGSQRAFPIIRFVQAAALLAQTALPLVLPTQQFPRCSVLASLGAGTAKGWRSVCCKHLAQEVDQLHSPGQ